MEQIDIFAMLQNDKGTGANGANVESGKEGTDNASVGANDAAVNRKFIRRLRRGVESRGGWLLSHAHHGVRTYHIVASNPALRVNVEELAHRLGIGD
jgi:hypothetical protein